MREEGGVREEEVSFEGAQAGDELLVPQEEGEQGTVRMGVCVVDGLEEPSVTQ